MLPDEVIPAPVQRQRGLFPGAPGRLLRPLCVDLDGTLIKSDSLIDSLLVLLRTAPLKAVRLPLVVFRGKAAFKAFVAQSISIDIAHLPYNNSVLRYLHLEHARERPLYLATGADQRLAHRVAAHLGIFTDVLASDGATNLTGRNKLDSLRTQLHSEAFDYIGNATPDLPLLVHATEPMLANPSLGLRLRLKARHIEPARVFVEHRPLFSSLVKALRPYQWAKNILIFAPLFLSHSLSMAKLRTALIAFACFSLTASSAYIVNDLLDIEADRRHPSKRMRPFAAGDLPATVGAFLAACLLLIGVLTARTLPWPFFAWLLIYLGTTLAYTWYLKRLELVDVLVLSGLYILRLLAGSAATQTPISHWLAGFSMFLFLSLAIVKRFAELENLRISNATPQNGRGYILADLNQLRAFGTASAYAAVVVFAIYISSPDVTLLYHDSRLLWMIVPLMILWLNRVWLLAARGKLNEDPVAFALTDPISLVIGALAVGIALLAL